MKKISLIMCLMAFSALSVLAQSVNIATLHKTSGVQNFTGTTALRQAHAAASHGDTIYLSGGMFAAPDSANKRLVIIGAGHYPDSTLATSKTLVSNNWTFYTAAANSHLEGIHFINSIYFATNQPVSNVTIRRCRFDGEFKYLYFNPVNTPCLNNTIVECVFAGVGLAIAAYDFGGARSLTIHKCLFFSGVVMFYTARQLTFTNNIVFSTNGTYVLYDIQNSFIKNNIFKLSTTGGMYSGSANYFANNVFIANTPSGYGGTAVNNFHNVTYADFFMNQTGNDFSYDHNYRLKTPASFVGDDGTQVGIYGTLAPYKDGSVPSNPHIRSKSIAVSTNLNGNLEVQVKVAAQQQ